MSKDEILKRTNVVLENIYTVIENWQGGDVSSHS